MAVDRSKYTSTKVSTLKSQEKEVKSKVQTSFQNDRVEWLQIEEGTNKLRIYPAHPGTDSFVYPRCTIWLERQVEYEKDGEKIREIVKRPVFNSKVHGSTPKDLVEEYVKFATKMLEDEIKIEQDDEAAKELTDKLATLQHWQNGLKYKTGWCFYANKYVNGQKHFGQIEVTNGIKEKMNELSATEDVDDPINTDPFTDVEEGKALIVTKTLEKVKNKKTGKTREETRYSATIEFRGNYALTDKELEEFEEVTPLEKIYKNSFRLRDFQLQLEGLQIYDKKNKLGVFEYDQFNDILEEIRAYYPSEEDEEQEEEEGAEETSNGGDEFDDMDRQALKKWINVNCPNKEIRILTSDSDDSLREKIRDFVALQEEGDEEEESYEEEAPKEEYADDLPWDENGNDKVPTKAAAKKASAPKKSSTAKASSGKKTSSAADDVKKKLGL